MKVYNLFLVGVIILTGVPFTFAGDYTKLDQDGKDLPATATSWSMVRDNNTGLTWEVKTSNGGIHDKDNSYYWCDNNQNTNGGNAGKCNTSTDTEKFIATLNSSKFGGYSNWRMPTKEEALSLIDDKIGTLNTDYFPNAFPNYCDYCIDKGYPYDYYGFYWTQTSSETYPWAAIRIFFINSSFGPNVDGDAKTARYGARAVATTTTTSNNGNKFFVIKGKDGDISVIMLGE